MKVGENDLFVIPIKAEAKCEGKNLSEVLEIALACDVQASANAGVGQMYSGL
ncbi:hypothetical protein D9M71_737380 [compost metagenome]